MLLKLLKKRGDIYYFRWQIPLHLRPIVGKSEIIKSLATDSLELAVLRAEPLKRWIVKLKKITNENYDQVVSELDELLSDWNHGQFPKKHSHLEITKNHLNNWIQSYEALLECFRLKLEPDSLDTEEALANSIQGLTIDLEKLGYEPLEKSANQSRLIEDYSKVELQNLLKQQAHYDPKSLAINATPYSSANRSYPKLSECIEPYIKHKQGNNSNLTDSSILSYRSAIADLIYILDDRTIDTITYDDAVFFRDTLLKLPPNRNKKYPDKSLSDLLSLNLPPDQTYSTTTINSRLRTLSSMYETFSNKYEYNGNPFKTVTIKVTKRSYSDFDSSDLSVIFSSDLYDPSSSYAKRSTTNHSHWWLPLFSLFSGARPGELIQLKIDDFKSEDGILYADLTDSDEEKRLKTKAARRRVPIHKKLIELGIEEYLSNAKKLNFDRFLEGVKEGQGQERASKYATRWFNEQYRPRFLSTVWVSQKKCL